LKIGIPDILPILCFALMGASALFMGFLFFEFGVKTLTGGTIFFAFMTLIPFSILVFLSYRFKIVIMTEKSIIVIIPFRLKYRNLNYITIEELDWELISNPRGGDVRKLIIKTNSGYQINILDVEFMNFDNLEKWLIDNTNLEQNLDKKFNIELQQAKSNWWLNMIVVVIIVVAFFFLSNIEIRADVRYSIQIALAIITWRLTHSLIKYQKTINENKRKKKQV